MRRKMIILIADLLFNYALWLDETLYEEEYSEGEDLS